MTSEAMAMSPTSRAYIQKRLDGIFEERFSVHPFSQITKKNDLKTILANYLAMSQAFPFLQAGVQKGMIFDVMRNKKDVPQDYEITASVGNFLCWDETGGHNAIMRHGQKGLSRILETRRRFHSNLLKDDLEKIFGEAVMPEYSPQTIEYLTQLYLYLSSLDSVRRVATMVAFERHAEQMIGALWESLLENYNVERDNLIYFRVHVGGEDPAEAYHVEMTFQMIQNIVSPEQEEEFYAAFTEAYALNFNWCEGLCQTKI